MRRCVKGSITVFLSLILLLILAVIGSTIDVVRLNIAGTYASRALNSAMDAEFTKYCEELYEDYHLFMIENDQDLDTIGGDAFVQSVSDYLAYCFDPDMDVTFLTTDYDMKGTDLMDLEVKSCKLEATTSMLDYEGTIFQHQVEEYMKYQVVAEGIDGTLEKLEQLKTSKKTMEVVRKKTEVEESVSKIDKKILKLMEEVEGLTIKDNGLKITKDKKIAIKDSFAKKFCTQDIRPSNVSIDHNLVWDSVKSEYVNPCSLLHSIGNDLKKVKEVSDQQNELSRLLEDLESKKEQLLQRLPSEVIDEEREPRNDEIEDYENYQSVLSEQKELKEKLEELGAVDTTVYWTEINEKAETLYNLSQDIIDHISNAKKIIKEIRGIQTESKEELDEFGGYLVSQKGEIPEDTYTGIDEEYHSLEKYVSSLDENGCDNSVVGNIVAMEECLSSNQEILEKSLKIEDYLLGASGKSVEEYCEFVEKLLVSYEQYTIKPLKFNYDTLTVDTSKTPSPFEGFADLISDGMIGLVVDETEKLSKADIGNMDLPSKTVITQEEETKGEEEKNNEDLAGKLKEQDGEKKSGVSSNMEYYESSFDTENGVGDMADGIARRFLLNEYGVTSFKNFITILDEESDLLSKGTALEYEQEYLICGGDNDFDNIKSIVMKTIFIRTALNYLSLVSDKGSQLKALQTATSLVGFTGFAPLISVTKHLILITWGFEEAFVDVRALLEGKELPLLKSASEFSIQYQELLCVSKELIRTKAEEVPERQESGIRLSYQDYLRFYLLVTGEDKLSYRMMDLIQGNMRVRYSKSFSIADGIFGARVSMSCELPGKFLCLPLIREMSGYDGRSATITMETEYSY